MDLYNNVNRDQEQGDCYATVNKKDRREDTNIRDDVCNRNEKGATTSNTIVNQNQPSTNFQVSKDYQDSYKKNISNPWMWISITALLLAIIAIGIAAAGFANENDLLKSDEDVKFLLTWKLYNGSIYRLTPNAQSWDESQLVCESYGAYLATSIVKHCLPLKQICQILVTNHAWIGLRTNSTKGWKLDGNKQVTSCWGPGQPDDYRQMEDCVETRYDEQYQLNDENCSAPRHGLCEKTFHE